LQRETVTVLRRMIVRGELAPGHKLREEELCARLAVSRTPLREAIRTLAHEGLVQLLSNRSAQVAALDLDQVEHLFEVVATLEARAAALACQHATADDLADLAALHARMKAHHRRGERSEYFALNLRIHRRMVAAARNPVLLSIYDTLLPQLERVRYLPSRRARRWPAAMEEHDAMAAALAARDAARLAALMRAHWENGAGALREAGDEAPAPVPAPRPLARARQR
jgi:DNA-binding GntR family transcriptional regulator